MSALTLDTLIKKRKISKRRSWVWNYFLFEENQTEFKCCQCGRFIKITADSSTNLLRRHLLDIHGICKATPLDRMASNIQINEYSDDDSDVETHLNQLESKLNHQKKIRIDQKLVDFLINSNQPFIVLENKAFKDFVHELNRSYNVPSRSYISETMLPEKV